MEEHGLMKANQRGFVSGRSTQTQLLQHYNDVFEALAEGVRIDTIYLDFAKAFDKVNHNILIKKVINHKIKGKIGIWIQNFLHIRKYRIVENGVMPDEHKLILGVPQRAVLAAILFITKITDIYIDKNVRNIISRSFADDR